jgi:hypothetical protein
MDANNDNVICELCKHHSTKTKNLSKLSKKTEVSD